MALALLLVLNLSIKISFAADTAPVTAPACSRPSDFSNAKLVLSYEDCVKRRTKFCDSHEKLKDCQKIKELQSYLAKPPATSKEPDPLERCSIQKDGSYKCIQDAIRFIEPEKPVAGGPSTISIPIDDNPTGSPAPAAASPAPSK